jgi:general secretion pathway protein I
MRLRENKTSGDIVSEQCVRKTPKGFTLIEVLVALTVLSLSLAIIFAGFSAGLRGRRTAEDYQRATVLAESKLISMGIETTLQEGHAIGRFNERFRWEATVSPYHEEGRDEANKLQRPLILTVTVLWGDKSDERSVSLTTLRLLPQQRLVPQQSLVPQ